MGKTAAEAFIEEGMQKGIEEGMQKGMQRALMALLGQKFGKLPRRVRAAVQGTTDEARLDHWLMEVLTARSIEDMGFGR